MGISSKWKQGVFGFWGCTIISEHPYELVAVTLRFGVHARICDVFWMILLEQLNFLFDVVPVWCRKINIVSVESS